VNSARAIARTSSQDVEEPPVLDRDHASIRRSQLGGAQLAANESRRGWRRRRAGAQDQDLRPTEAAIGASSAIRRRHQTRNRRLRQADASPEPIATSARHRPRRRPGERPRYGLTGGAMAAA